MSQYFTEQIKVFCKNKFKVNENSHYFLSLQFQKQIAIPYNQRDGQYERCSVYDVNWWLYTNEQLLNDSKYILRCV